MDEVIAVDHKRPTFLFHTPCSLRDGHCLIYAVLHCADSTEDCVKMAKGNCAQHAIEKTFADFCRIHKQHNQHNATTTTTFDEGFC